MMSAFSYFFGLKDSNLGLFSVVVVVDKAGKKSSNGGAGLSGLYGTGLATTLYLDS